MQRAVAGMVVAHLEGETRALVARLAELRPFAFQMPTVPAAAPEPAALAGIDRHLLREKQKLERELRALIAALRSAPANAAAVDSLQRRYTILKLRFHAVLNQLDIFADVITQRSEHDVGVRLAGLDALARDGLRLVGLDLDPPPLAAYLERGLGAAIRRARTRLPGGARNPVSIIQVPRERMVGFGVGGSLLHEVGHQGAALLDLVAPLKEMVAGRSRGEGDGFAWLSLWISEIVADLWSVAFLGASSTLGLMGVLSLPRPFIFRIGAGDPHPMPWLRVRISCALGRSLHPDPQWAHIERLWSALHPVSLAPASSQPAIAAVLEVLPEFAAALTAYAPARLRGLALRDVLPARSHRPDELRRIYRRAIAATRDLTHLRPSLALAAVGQARFERAIDAAAERRTLERLLRHWALQPTFDPSATTRRAPSLSPRVAA